MYRLLAPGGRIVHTLDMTPEIHETTGMAFLEGVVSTGMLFEKQPRVDYTEVAKRAVISEPAAIVFKYYFGERPYRWKNPPPINQHTCTIKLIARKLL